MKGRSQAIDLIGLVAGFAIWSSAFIMLYGLHGGVCEARVVGESGGAYLRLTLVAILAVHLLAHAALIWWFARRLNAAGEGPQRFLRLVALLLAVLALGSTLWTSSPVLFLSLCS